MANMKWLIIFVACALAVAHVVSAHSGEAGDAAGAARALLGKRGGGPRDGDFNGTKFNDTRPPHNDTHGFPGDGTGPCNRTDNHTGNHTGNFTGKPGKGGRGGEGGRHGRMLLSALAGMVSGRRPQDDVAPSAKINFDAVNKAEAAGTAETGSGAAFRSLLGKGGKGGSDGGAKVNCTGKPEGLNKTRDGKGTKSGGKHGHGL